MAYGTYLADLSSVQKQPDNLLGYLEVHIEQGPVLEAAGLPVGIVAGIAGQNRLEVEFLGEAGHAGTVPMAMRLDALVAASRFVVAVQEHARRTEGLVATVGQINALPGASNAVPGQTIISLDVRHLDDALREAAVADLYAQALAIAANEHVELHWRLVAASTSVHCAPAIIDLLSQAVQQTGIEPKLLNSGAGHDTVMLSHLTQVGMLFVRCRRGISHNPAEYTSPADAETAADVLLAALHRLAENQ
jgi:allantoate deiminase